MEDPKTVLVAEDDDWLRGLLTILLADAGFQPLEASSGPETVRLARRRLPDAIVLDVGLPGKSGLRVMQELRAEPPTQDIPVVLVSGQVNLHEIGHAHDGEAAFHKPLDVGALVTRLESITGG